VTGDIAQMEIIAEQFAHIEHCLPTQHGNVRGFRRIFSRFDKLDALLIGCIRFALIADGLRLCQQALARSLAPRSARCAHASNPAHSSAAGASSA
jgi:hypothetical protein